MRGTVERRTTFLELFFDLVFVYAITQIAGIVREDGSVRGFASAALVFLIVWWAWSQFTWLGNAIDLENRLHRLAVLAAAGTAFFMARGVPDAYEDGAAWFTVSYGLTMAIGLSLYWWGLRDDPGHQAALKPYLAVVVPGTLLVVAAGFVGPGVRTWIYIVAVITLLASGAAAVRSEAWRMSPGHFAERHSLIVIIALGESMIAVGVAAAGLENTTRSVISIAIGVVGALALWWAYFDWLAEKTEVHFRETPDARKAPFARDAYTFGHYPLVFGIVAFSIAVEEAVAHPAEALDAAGRFGLGAGVGMYLVATAVVHIRSGGGILVDRIGGAVAMALLVALGADLEAVVALGGVVLILISALGLEWYRHRRAGLRAAVVGSR